MYDFVENRLDFSRIEQVLLNVILRQKTPFFCAHFDG